MSYYEFKLKHLAFYRQRKYEMEMNMVYTRKIVLASYWGFNGDYKQFPKRETDIFKTSFDDYSVSSNRASQETLDKFDEEWMQYLQKVNPTEYNRLLNNKEIN